MIFDGDVHSGQSKKNLVWSDMILFQLDDMNCLEFGSAWWDIWYEKVMFALQGLQKAKELSFT